MDVAVALLAPEARDVQPLGLDHRCQGETGTVDGALQSGVLVHGEVIDDLLAMGDRCDQEMPVEVRVLRQEHDRLVVAVDDVVLVADGARQQLANEARRSGASDVGVVDVPRNSLGCHRPILVVRTSAVVIRARWS